jgi:hypothetical protein
MANTTFTGPVGPTRLRGLHDVQSGLELQEHVLLMV